MASNAVHQVTFSARAAALVAIAVLAALALAVSLPLALRGTHTVFVKTAIPASPTSTTSNPVELMRASHGG